MNIFYSERKILRLTLDTGFAGVAVVTQLPRFNLDVADVAPNVAQNLAPESRRPKVFPSVTRKPELEPEKEEEIVSSEAFRK